MITKLYRMETNDHSAGKDLTEKVDSVLRLAHLKKNSDISFIGRVIGGMSFHIRYSNVTLSSSQILSYQLQVTGFTDDVIDESLEVVKREFGNGLRFAEVK